MLGRSQNSQVHPDGRFLDSCLSASMDLDEVGLSNPGSVYVGPDLHYHIGSDDMDWVNFEPAHPVLEIRIEVGYGKVRWWPERGAAR